MSLSPLRKVSLVGLLAALLLSATAAGALLEYKGLRIEADGGFQPQKLPRHRFAPIKFQGHIDISSRNGAPPPELRQAVVEFDRDGHLDVNGLPTCPLARIANTTTAQVRHRCAGAVVGTGTVGALVELGAGSVDTHWPLTILNGPRLGGHPTAVLHVRASLPSPQTYVIVAPIERRAGPFAYRVTIDLPPLAEGAATLSRLAVSVGREFRAGGKTHSYVSARCSDGVLATHGRFTFADGTIIEGAVEKYCRAE